MRTKIRMILAAIATTALVLVPSTAHAADFKVFSTTGKSYMWYDDANDRVVVCDMVPNDGIGAYGLYWSQRIVYNGCEAAGQVPDDWRSMYAHICDWVFSGGERRKANCHTIYAAP